MTADGRVIPRDSMLVDADGVTVTFPVPVSSVRITHADVDAMKTAIESAALASPDDADLPVVVLDTNTLEGE